MTWRKRSEVSIEPSQNETVVSKPKYQTRACLCYLLEVSAFSFASYGFLHAGAGHTSGKETLPWDLWVGGTWCWRSLWGWHQAWLLLQKSQTNSSVEIRMLHYATEDSFSWLLRGNVKAKWECSCSKIQARGLWKLFSKVTELPELQPGRTTRTFSKRKRFTASMPLTNQFLSLEMFSSSCSVDEKINMW